MARFESGKERLPLKVSLHGRFHSLVHFEHDNSSSEKDVMKYDFAVLYSLFTTARVRKSHFF